jgi:DNA-binding XRE family transcriptional regulator
MMVKLIALAELKAKMMKDPAFAAAYAEADAEFAVIEAMIRARAEAGLTQEALAERMGTTQSAVARLEGGRVSPTVETLRKYAKAVGKRLKVEMV